MAIATHTRRLRFVLFAFFFIAVFFKIFSNTKSALIKPQGPLAFQEQPKTKATNHHGHTVAKGARANAVFVTLARNSDIWEISDSIKQVEDRFNRRYNYDWVFLNDEEFDDQFKKVISNLVSGNAYFGLVPKEHWSFPDWIDQEKAAKVREEMSAANVIYGHSISYRHMCRFESGFFFRHELLKKYDYYWRVEPGIKLFCDVTYDPFMLMKENNKTYGFTLSLKEYPNTIETLWATTKDFMIVHPEHIAENNSMKFISDDDGDSYNLCHFWSNFEIGSLNFFRSKAYMDYFEHLDKAGGFFYERWGDAPVHSIAASLLLPKDQIHFFDEIAYYHIPFTHCPTSEAVRLKGKCSCKPSENFDWNGYSCTSKYFEINGYKKPNGS